MSDKFCKPWKVDGRKGGWMEGRMEAKVGLRIAYSNQKWSKSIDFNWNKDQNRSIIIKIAIVDSNLLLEFESDQNRRSNLDFKFDLTTTIWFGTPNGISLLFMHACLPFWLEAGLLHGNLAQKEGTIVLQIVTQALKKVYLSTVFPNLFFYFENPFEK